MAHPELPAARLRLEPVSASLLPELHAFHSRLQEKGGPHYRLGTVVPEAGQAERGPRPMETLLVVDGDAVRGGIMLQRQQFKTTSGTLPVVNIQLPLSEGTVDRNFAHVGMWLMRAVMKMQPRVFAVGMGSMEQPLPTLLKAMRWTVVAVPFYFFVNRPFQFLRRMPVLRRSLLRRMVSSTAAFTGAGWAALRIKGRLDARRAGANSLAPRVSAHRIEAWGTWANDVWNDASQRCSLSAVRDAAALNALYPPDAPRTFCFRVNSDERIVGWFALQVTQMKDSNYFGNLTVGTVLDAQCLSGFEGSVVRAALRELDKLGADLSITNQLHRDWQNAFRGAGFISAPSNYLFAATQALAKPGENGDVLEFAHITRGDGDGRINL